MGILIGILGVALFVIPCAFYWAKLIDDNDTYTDEEKKNDPFFTPYNPN